jgi:dynactin complex subunit
VYYLIAVTIQQGRRAGFTALRPAARTSKGKNMRTTLIAASCLFLAAAAPQQTMAQTPQAEIAALKQEVRTLRLEVLQQKAEFQHWKVQNLTSWLEQTKNERQRATGDAQASRQELAELEMATRAATEHQTPELDAAKEKLAKDELPKVERWLQSLLQRESELASELHSEGARLSATQQQIQRITAEAAGR